MTSIPLRDFFRNPDTTSYSISPAGDRLAYMAPVNRRMNVFCRPVSGGEARALTDLTDRDISGYFWKGNDTVLYIKDTDGDENYHLYAVDVHGGESRALTVFPGVRTRIVDDWDEIDDGALLVGLNRRQPEIHDVYRLDLANGDLTLVAENPGNITDWITDHEGRLRAAVATDGVNSTLLARDTENDEFQPLLTTTFRDTVSPLFYTFDNRALYALSNLGRDTTALVVLDLNNGTESSVLYNHPEVDISGVSYSKRRRTLTALSYVIDKRERVFWDDETREVHDDLARRLPGVEVSVSDHDLAENRLIVRTYNDRDRGGYYLYDRGARSLDKLCDISPWLDPAQMAPMEPVRYTSRDGLTIRGYLTLPQGERRHPLPVVVHPHGGPWARDYWGFNPTVQFLANRGYAVLQMNFRGSTGFGRSFWEASFKQWGLAMQDDISDGVHWLIDRGIADPERIAIYGASYGGYAVLAGLTLTPDLYACGIDYVGVSNLFTFMNTIPPYWTPYLEMLHEMVGDPDRDRDRMEQTSPVFHAEAISRPLLIAQGARDPRVNKDESDQMVGALRERGVDVEYIVKENEGHGFHNEENRFEFYEVTERFLAKHLERE